MKLLLKARKIKLDASTKDYVKHRVSFAFARSRDLIKTLTITIADVNGPKGGNDKQCKVLIRTSEHSDIIITETQSNLKESIDRALTRSSHNFLQRVKRKQHLFKSRIKHHALRPLESTQDERYDDLAATT
jgi:ribosome-associated translation inhibitor RaiA